MTALTASRLIRLYPRWWRERYADEFLDLVGEERVGIGTALNIVAGALDARMSRPRPAAAERTAAGPEGGAIVMDALRLSCRRSARLSTRDSMIGAAVILGVSALSALLGIAVVRAGFETIGEVVMSFGFPVSLVLAMPFTYLKGQPWKVQAVLVGGQIAILALTAWVTILIA